ncbi:hypothetical protein PN36_27485 [Candidatus Thiomargarita nelsonii]|uniref:Uncharacterized protein n=1 Tax=Candidatus Thiomargarita nelsonii TaxID=1003181 RepID=A0A0A6PFI2_9GAMM|nr:hypothetical protein PN36_27485 [Candidatus Thiomargarita nelsonii]
MLISLIVLYPYGQLTANPVNQATSSPSTWIITFDTRHSQRHDIVSILMWESGLGEFTGNLRIFNIFMAQLLFLERARQHAIEQMNASEMAAREKKRFNKIKK